jgi:hypothetical protein
MISEDVIKQLADSAESHRHRAANCLRELIDNGDTPMGTTARLLGASEALAVEYDQVANVCRLLNSDECLRDALEEARDRKADAITAELHEVVAHSVAYWDRVAAKFRERTGGGSAAGLTPEQCERLVGIANEMRGEGETLDRRAAMHQAVNEIQDITLAMGKPCEDCGEPALTLLKGKPVCVPCFDVANAGQFGPTDPAEQADAMADHEDDQPTVIEVRTSLVKVAMDFHKRRQPHSKLLHTPGATDADFDAYEGMSDAGCFAQALAAALWIVNEREGCGELAADLAAVVSDVIDNGADGLEYCNADVWDLIEKSEAEQASDDHDAAPLTQTAAEEATQ